VFNLRLAAMFVPEEDGVPEEYGANQRYLSMMPP